MNKIICGDCLIEMRKLKENSVDTIITDPPYALGFMGKAWDKFPSDIGPKKPFANQSKEQKLGGIKFQNWTEGWAKEALRVAKPGATLLCFGGTRTYHRLACAIEDAGWVIKDCIMWLYGSGFPKATDISKQLDKRAGKKGKIIGKNINHRTLKETNCMVGEPHSGDGLLREPATPEAQQWNGWKSHGLKPAYEPIIVAMKPNEGSYAENALKWEVSGLNINGGRIGFEDTPNPATNPKYRLEAGYKLPARGQKSEGAVQFSSSKNKTNIQGRFPSNIILDQEATELLDEQSGDKCGQLAPTKGNEPSTLKQGNVYGDYSGYGKPSQPKDKLGGASRFFKVIKPYYYQDKEYNVKGFIKKCKPQAPSNYNDKGRTSRYFKEKD